MRILKSSFAYFRQRGSLAALFLTVLLGVCASLWLPENIAGYTYEGDRRDRFNWINFNRLVEDYRKAILEIAGGFILVYALDLGRRRIVAAEELARASARALDLTREAQTTDRMIKAISQLGTIDQEGAKHMELRLGGIYILERIARESPDDHWTIMEVLTAYLRHNALVGTSSYSHSETAGDVQAIITVLGQRQYKSDRASLNLRGTALPSANIRGAHLEEADFSNADLDRAALVEAHLEGATLAGASLREAQLTDAYLEGAHIAEANLAGVTAYRACLQRAELAGANLQRAVLAGAQLQKADLTRACLQGAKLAGAHLEGAILLDARLEQADLTRAYLHGANLAGVVDLTQKQIDAAYGDGTTQLPLGLDYPPHWYNTAIHMPAATAGDSPSVEVRGKTIARQVR